MGNKLGLKVLAISIALALIASSAAMYGYSATDVEKGMGEGGGNGIISLVAPSFITTARAAGGGGGGGAGGGGAFPEDEAGISAYINTSQRISIEKIKKIFTVVEEVGDNYIIGLTPISNFGGDIDVHVYADTSGWIVAYLKTAEPASKIMQWGTADPDNPVIAITTTILEDALYKAGNAAGVGIRPAAIGYYDFRYPNANGMTIFVRTRATKGANIHQVEIPVNYALYEASYYHYVTAGYSYYLYSTDSNLKVDGATVSKLSVSTGGRNWNRAFGSYREAITTGTLHEIEISYGHDYSGSAGVATVLIYRTA